MNKVGNPIIVLKQGNSERSVKARKSERSP